MLAFRAPAETLRVVSYVDGVAVSDAEACFWPGRNFEDFHDRFLSSGDVHCYPIGNVPRPPDGVWNYYMQSPSRISTHPDGIQLIGPGGVRPLRADLLPAGTLDLRMAKSTLRAGEFFALYVSNEHRDSSQPAVRPIPAGAASVLVPADMHTLLLIVAGEQIVWASRPLLLHAGETLQAPVRNDTTRDVIVLAGLDRSAFSEERDAIKGLPPPDVLLTDGKRTLHPAFPLRPAPWFDTSVVEFTDVPPGDYTVRLGGPYWLSDSVPVAVRPGSTTVAQPSRRLVTLPVARMDIHWFVSHQLKAARPAVCGENPTPKTSATHLNITRCAFGFAAPADCRTIHDVELLEDSGVLVREQLPPGDYYVILRNAVTSTRNRVSLAPGRTAVVNMTLAPGHIRGRITRGGSPLAAVVSFATGSTSSDERGEYDALVSAVPESDRPVVITPCDTHHDYVDLPVRDFALNDTYDIDVPENVLSIRVRDAVTAAALSIASVTSRIITPEHTISSRMLGRTNDAGLISDMGLSEHVTFELCAQHEGYDGACLQGIRMRQQQESATISLQPARGRVVHVIAEPPIGPGRIYLVAGSAVVAEATIEPDHTVHLDPAMSSAMLYLVTTNQPLIRLPFPDLTQPEAVIRVPAVHGIVYSVTLPPDSPHHGGPVALEIDGIPLPDAVLLHSQALHNASEPHLLRGETITIGPLDDALKAAVLLWPDNSDLPADLQVPAPFTNPRTSGLMIRAPLTSEHVTLAGPP